MPFKSEKQRHPSHHAYNHGCRCDLCREFKSLYNAGRRTLRERSCEQCASTFNPWGRQRWCKSCVPDIKHRSRLTRYGVAKPEFDRMYEEQKGLCAVCGTSQAVAVDHNHETGTVRALLCLGCNGALGRVEDLEWLTKAQTYLALY